MADMGSKFTRREPVRIMMCINMPVTVEFTVLPAVDDSEEHQIVAVGDAPESYTSGSVRMVTESMDADDFDELDRLVAEEMGRK